MDIFCLIVLAIAVVVPVAAVVIAIRLANSKKSHTLTVWHIVALGVAIALFATFLPVFYCDFFKEGTYYFNYVTPTLLAILNVGRTFLLDGQFELVRETANAIDNPALQCGFLHYSALLHLVAPVFTAGYVLSIIKNFFANLRFSATKKRKVYIMSVLNDRSKALAYDIFDTCPDNEKILIVFAGIENYRDLDEDDKHFLKTVKATHLIKDIDDLSTKNKCHVEFFLIDEDESNNLNKAKKIIEKETDEFNRYVFVFARSESVGVVLDSVKQDRDVDKFKIRRVDDVYLLTRRTLQNSNVHLIRKNKAQDNDVISILIVGMGKYGVSFLKNSLWFCQMHGVKVEINVVDKRPENDGDSYSVIKELEHDCPELLKFNDCNIDGEANYSIRFFTGVDCFVSDFDALFDRRQNHDAFERIRRTDMAFVNLGDDDLNINASVMLRTLFDRMNNVKATVDTVAEEDMPIIYSVVYDTVKTENLKIGERDFSLVNQSNIPYHITFIGCLKDDFKYDMIYDKRCEDDAVYYHVEWVNADEKAQKIKPDRAEQKRKDEIIKYELKEYYRISSISKSIHKAAIKDLVADMTDEEVRITEHMRWNAYMRTMGYVYGPVKNERAKVHNNLVAYSQLSEYDKSKD